MNKAKILVVGSSNTDMVVKSAHLPRPGETILGGSFLMNPGGKGANQAVAAVRLGAEVSFVCKIGKDVFGKEAKTLFEKEGMNISGLIVDPKNPSGVALIMVDEKAENCISVASGANANLLPSDLGDIKALLEKADIVLLQLEIPMETVEYVAHLAAQMGKRVILNPAPAQDLSSGLLKDLFLITPNETEAGMISGVIVRDHDSAVEAARKICKMGVHGVVITMGSHGVLIYEDGKSETIPAFKVDAVDTTAAGDVFNGALSVALSEGKSLSEASVFAAQSAAISVTRMGAQASVPYRKEIDHLI